MLWLIGTIIVGFLAVIVLTAAAVAGIILIAVRIIRRRSRRTEIKR